MGLIIGISGKIGSGKDTIGQMIIELTRKEWDQERLDKMSTPHVKIMGGSDNTFKTAKFAEKLKQIASIMTGVPREKFEDQEFKDSNMPSEWNSVQSLVDMDGNSTGVAYFMPMTYRTFLQRLGTEAIRGQIHENAWVNAAMTDVKETDNVIFTDVRFPNEADAIRQRGGILIRINRYPPGCSPKLMDEHPSEKSLDEYKFDHVIYNLGTLDDLKNQIKEILRHLHNKTKSTVIEIAKG